jgi:hypothetical protein
MKKVTTACLLFSAITCIPAGCAARSNVGSPESEIKAHVANLTLIVIARPDKVLPKIGDSSSHSELFTGERGAGEKSPLRADSWIMRA